MVSMVTDHRVPEEIWGEVGAAGVRDPVRKETTGLSEGNLCGRTLYSWKAPYIYKRNGYYLFGGHGDR